MKEAVRLLRYCTYAAALVLIPAVTFAQHYVQTNLGTDLASGATLTNDADLKNPWGLTRSAGGPWWVSDNNAGVSTVYNGNTGAKLLVVVVPGPEGTTLCTTTTPPTPQNCFVSAPTGIVFNGSSDFEITPGNPSAFILDTEDGTISAWAGGSCRHAEG